MTDPRKHHYLPKCYLKSFAVPRKKSFQTTVFDARVRKIYQSDISNIAAQRDFNRVDSEGIDPYIIERKLSEFESDLGTAIERTIYGKKFKDFEDKYVILTFMCLAAIRNPRLRALLNRFQSRTAKLILSTALASKERWETQVCKARDSGFMSGPDVPYEKMKLSFENDEYEFVTSTGAHSKVEFGIFDEVLQTFIRRKWTLLNINHLSGNFITSDHPVCIIWSLPGNSGLAPGFGMPNTEVYFPLSPKVALIGLFEGEDGEQKINENMIPEANGIIAANAEWQVFARDLNFNFTSKQGEPTRKASRLIDDLCFRRPRPS